MTEEARPLSREERDPFTESFDQDMQWLTQERGKNYGHPLDDFARAESLAEIIGECPDKEIRHALRMISVKIARLIQTPDHYDSVLDIAGYARTICMILDERVHRGAK